MELKHGMTPCQLRGKDGLSRHIDFGAAPGGMVTEGNTGLRECGTASRAVNKLGLPTPFQSK